MIWPGMIAGIIHSLPGRKYQSYRFVFKIVKKIFGVFNLRLKMLFYIDTF